AVIEVEQHDLMTEVGVAGDGASAAVLRVARVAAGDNDLKLARALFGRVQGKRSQRADAWKELTSREWRHDVIQRSMLSKVSIRARMTPRPRVARGLHHS